MGALAGFDTSRLSLRQRQDCDAAPLAHALSNPRILAWMPSAKRLDESMLEQLIRKDTMDPVDFCVFELGSNALIGRIHICGSSHELHYWLKPCHWGSGLGSEMLEGLCDRLRRHSLMDRVLAYCLRENTRSRRMLEKNDFEFKGLRQQPLQDRVAGPAVLSFQLCFQPTQTTRRIVHV